MKLNGRVSDWNNLHEISNDRYNCNVIMYMWERMIVKSVLLDGWMKENACKIIDSDIEPW